MGDVIEFPEHAEEFSNVEWLIEEYGDGESWYIKGRGDMSLDMRADYFEALAQRMREEHAETSRSRGR